MAERRDEDIQLDIDKNQQNISQKLKESEQKINLADQAAQEQLNKVKQMAQFQGTAIEIAQQNSLVLLAGQYLTAALLAMLLVQLGPLGAIITWIPFLEKLCFLVYVIILLVVQFSPTSFENKPTNFIVFVGHSVAKILLIVYFTIRWESVRFELYALLFSLIILYILNLIKSAIIQKEDINLSVKSNFFKLLIFAAAGGAVLSLLTRMNLFYMIILAAVGVGYAFVLMLALQRYPEHEYLTKNENDFYIGAAQLDSDFFLFCKLVAFHLFEKKRLPIQEEDKEQAAL